MLMAGMKASSACCLNNESVKEVFPNSHQAQSSAPN